MAPREPRAVEHPDTMSGEAPRHCLELGVMDPQGHSPDELVLEPQQPHKQDPCGLMASVPIPAGPRDLCGSLATAIYSGCCCQTMAGC